jgi:hypothetical protein
MIRNLSLSKLLNHKINHNLIGYTNFTGLNNLSINQFINCPNNNYQTYRYDHIHSKTILTTNTNQNKLSTHELGCSNKILSNEQFDLKIRNIVQEELKKNNSNSNLESQKNLFNDNELEHKIKHIVALEIDKIKESMKNDISNLNTTNTNTTNTNTNTNTTNPSTVYNQSNDLDFNKTSKISIFTVSSIFITSVFVFTGINIMLISMLGPVLGTLSYFFIYILLVL